MENKNSWPVAENRELIVEQQRKEKYMNKRYKEADKEGQMCHCAAPIWRLSFS